MGRRKKEPESVHRGSIAAAAERLFAEKGIEQTTMDDIARQAGYSKATLYVYFKNKEAIVAVLVLESMTKLYACIHEALAGPGSVQAVYRRVCRAVARYQQASPFYFSLALRSIRVDLDRPDCLEVERQTYEVGEKINGDLAGFLQEGMHRGALRPDLDVLPTVFLFWASLSGLIAMAEAKQAYIEKAMGMTAAEFLNSGFDMLYSMIAKEGAQ